MTDCYIYDAIRTPRGKGKKNGTLHEVTALELATQVPVSYTHLTLPTTPYV